MTVTDVLLAFGLGALAGTLASFAVLIAAEAWRHTPWPA